MELQEVKPVVITKTKNFINKEITLAPPKGKLLTYQQIRNFCKEKEKTFKKGTKMVVRAENILKTTTLYSTYSKKWDTDQEWDEYLNGAAEETDKYKAFFNFTVTLIIPT